MSIDEDLKIQKAELLESLRQKTVESRDVDVEELERIEKYSRLIQQSKPRINRVFLIFALVSTFLAAGITLTVPEPRLSFELEASSIEVVLDKEWKWHSPKIPMEELRLSQMTMLEVPSKIEGAPPVRITNNVWSSFSKGEYFINTLTLDANSRLRVQITEHGEVNFILSNSARGSVSVRAKEGMGVTEVEWGNNKDNKYSSQEVVTQIPMLLEFSLFRQKQSGVIPAIIEMVPLSEIKLERIPVRKILLTERNIDADGSTEIDCVVTNGSLRFVDTSTVRSLKKGECLSMTGETGSISELVVDGDKGVLEVTYEGRADKIEVGPKWQLTDVTPSIIEWIYHNNLMRIIWTVIGCIWLKLLWNVGQRQISYILLGSSGSPD